MYRFNGVSPIEAFLISVGERTEADSYNSILNQSIPVNRISVVRNIRGIHNALNAVNKKVTSEFYVRVDADMVLDRDCVEVLYGRIKKDTNLCRVQGLLRDPFLGRIWGISIFRSCYTKYYHYSGNIGQDREFDQAMQAKGYRLEKYKKLLGVHHPDYTFKEIACKFIHEGKKIAFYRNKGRLDSDMSQLIKLAGKGSIDAFFAIFFIGIGLVQPGAKDKDFCLCNELGLSREKILESSGIVELSSRKEILRAANAVAKKCSKIFYLNNKG
ncbi:MAG: glycosyltransferase [Candidatus Omnitrophica bacterium]|nr:glycosyltransferase [Candidatus Omnitrophota bacterium]